MKIIVFTLFIVIYPVLLFAQCNPDAGSDDQICGNEYTLQGSIGIVGSDILWTSLTPGVVFGDQSSLTTEANIPIITGLSQIVTFVLTETNTTAPCTVSDTVQINFIRQPVAQAGPITSDPYTNTYFPGIYGPNSQIKADTVCGLAYNLHAVPSYGNGLWYTLDPVNTWFESTGTSSPSPLYNDIINIIFHTVFSSPYYRQFVWVEDNQSCIDKDTIRIYFAPRPSGNFTATMPACRYDSSMIVAFTWPMPNHIDYGLNYFGWDYGNGVIWDTSVNIYSQNTIYVSWPSGNSHSVTLCTHNLWGCVSTINQHYIYEPPLFDPDYDINPATCGNSNGEVLLSTGWNSYSFEWLDTSIVDPFDTGQYGLTPGNAYHIVVTGESFSPDATPGTMCHDTISINMTNAGDITAFFDTLFTQNMPIPQTIPFINLTNNGRYYYWYFYDSTGDLIYSSTNENPAVTFTNPGCYQIVLIAESKVDTSWFGIERFGCKDTFEYQWLCFDNTNIEDINRNHLTFYPNPADDIMFIRSDVALKTAVVYDLSGRIVTSKDFLYPDRLQSVFVGDLAPGLYLLGCEYIDHSTGYVRFNKE